MDRCSVTIITANLSLKYFNLDLTWSILWQNKKIFEVLENYIKLTIYFTNGL